MQEEVEQTEEHAEEAAAAPVKKHRFKKRKGVETEENGFVLKEAELSGSEDSSDEEEDEKDEYEYDDFTVPTGMEDEEEPQQQEKKKRKKKRRRVQEEALEEDDIELLREAGQNIPRRKQPTTEVAKKFNRLKQKRGGNDLESNIRSTLFGDDSGKCISLSYSPFY